MSKTRMAGEALQDANFEARQRLSNDPEEAARRAGLVDDKYDVSGFSDKDISMALMGSLFGDEDYARLTGKSFGDDKPSPASSPTEPAPGTSQPRMETGDISATDGGIAAPVQQDNDITNTGDNNTISQDNSIKQRFITDNSFTDNSVRTYGGDTRSFTYNAGKGNKALYDSPVSAATMGGFYDTSDSPAKAQKFMDMYMDSNNLAQRKNKQEYDRTKMDDYGPNDLARIGDLESDLDASTKGSFRSSRRRSRDLFGKSPFAGNFALPKVPNPPKDNVRDIYEDSIERIDSL